MIRQFDSSTALLLIDVQKGVNDTNYYGGPSGRRNNPGAEDNMCSILIEWRKAGRQVAFTKHDSREKNSPLKLSLETGQQLEGLDEAKRGDGHQRLRHAGQHCNHHGEADAEAPGH